MARPRRLVALSTPFPEAEVFQATGQPDIDEADWTALSLDLWQSITTAYSVRGPMEENLKTAMRLYELEVQPKNFPYEDSSNIAVPIIVAKLDTMFAQVAAKTLVPEFYICNGGENEDAQIAAYKIQQFYNTELRRQRGTKTWFDAHLRWLHLALRDGTAFMEVLWKREKRIGRYGVRRPATDTDGMPVIDSSGQVQYTTGYEHREVVDYDDVEMNPVWLRDLLIIPDESMDLDSAVALARATWPYESDLREMIGEGLLKEQWVDRALDYVPQGTSDVASDRQGNYDKSAGRQIQIGMGQGLLGSRFFRNRGPLKVWRIHSNQFDMNGDGIPEHNVFWLHELSTFMLGWCPAEYIAPGRPIFGFCPLPRPDRPYGYGIPERLHPIYQEMSKWHNDRNDFADLRLWPPMLINRNEEVFDKGMEWGPGKTWPVSDIDNAAKPLEVQDVPIATFQEESLLGSYADQLLGIPQTMTGAQSSGRRSATEVQVTTGNSGTRSDMVAMLFRIACRQVINYAHKLKMQYTPTQDLPPALQNLPPEIMQTDVQIEVAGLSDPLDADSNFQNILGMYNLLSQDRDIATNAVHRYELKKQLLQAARWQNVDALIGTEDEARQKLQSESKMMSEQTQTQSQLGQAEVMERTAKAHHEDASIQTDMMKAQADQASAQAPPQGAPQQPENTGTPPQPPELGG